MVYGHAVKVYVFRSPPPSSGTDRRKSNVDQMGDAYRQQIYKRFQKYEVDQLKSLKQVHYNIKTTSVKCCMGGLFSKTPGQNPGGRSVKRGGAHILYIYIYSMPKDFKSID